MNSFFCITIATILTSVAYPFFTAQITIPYSRNPEVLRQEEKAAIVVMREVIPGIVTFNRQNGCSFQSPSSTNFLDDGNTLETSVRLAVSGNSIPLWRHEYRKPWKSELTDYDGGEYKIPIFQMGKHPSTLIGVEESDKKLVDAQISCAAFAYKIFGNNLRLLQPIPEPRQNNLSLPLMRGWEIYFDD